MDNIIGRGSARDAGRRARALLGEDVAAGDLDVVVRERVLEPGVVDDLVDLPPLADESSDVSDSSCETSDHYRES